MLSTLIVVMLWVAHYFIFKKMGREGWEGLVPFYNWYVLFEVLYGNGWKFLLLLIPLYNIYLLIKLNVDLAHEFNQSTGFALGLIFLPNIFYLILGLSSSIQFRDGSTYASFAGSFSSNGNANTSSKADDLLKFKELLDMGAITQEEFDAKKKELLNL